MCAHREWSSETFWSATGTGITVTVSARGARRATGDQATRGWSTVFRLPESEKSGRPTKCQLYAPMLYACAIARGAPMVGSPLPTQNSHSPRPSDLTARFQRPAAVYSRPRYSPLYPGTVNSEPGAGRSGFSYRIPRVHTPTPLHTAPYSAGWYRHYFSSCRHSQFALKFGTACHSTM